MQAETVLYQPASEFLPVIDEVIYYRQRRSASQTLRFGVRR
jgi:hypothetical protein